MQLRGLSKIPNPHAALAPGYRMFAVWLEGRDMGKVATLAVHWSVLYRHGFQVYTRPRAKKSLQALTATAMKTSGTIHSHTLDATTMKKTTERDTNTA